MPRRLLEYSRTQPSRTIASIVAVLMVLRGLLLLTPVYEPVFGTAVSELFGLPLAASAMCHIAIGAVGLVMLRKNCPLRVSQAGFVMFIWQLFLTISPLAMGHVSNLRWITNLTLALILAVVYIEQSAVARLVGRANE